MRPSIMILTLSLLGTSCWAQRDVKIEPADRKKVALVIGNNTYPRAALRNAVNDAQLMARTLRETGFQVEALTDGDARGMDAAVNRLVSLVSPGDVALFYFAGHGMQIDGELPDPHGLPG
jgi:hypothetical protein